MMVAEFIYWWAIVILAILTGGFYLRSRRLAKVISSHELCHDLHGKVGPLEFAEGCENEQRKLYGCAPHADELAASAEKIQQLLSDNRSLATILEKTELELVRLRTENERLKLDSERKAFEAERSQSRNTRTMHSAPKTPTV